MSQVGNVLRMLVLLKGNGMMKIKELAQIIGVDERTIRRYKDDLEQARIYVNSKAGRFGGYYLDEDYLLSLKCLLQRIHFIEFRVVRKGRKAI